MWLTGHENPVTTTVTTTRCCEPSVRFDLLSKLWQSALFPILSFLSDNTRMLRQRHRRQGV